ncbi:MAG TPA: multiheme c-type cytochrome [Polyangiaceae bacterium]|nr:multiheme c-type cytochrome [Polyangiaceae bacterium]
MAAVLCLTARQGRANGRLPGSNRILAPSQFPNLVIVRATYGILPSMDDGTTWSFLCEDALGLPETATIDPALALTSSGALVAGISPSPAGLDVSNDDGCSWTCAGGSLAGQAIADLAVRPNAPDSVVALTATFDTVDGGTTASSQVFESTDDGAHWTELGSPIDPSVIVTTVDVAASDPNRLYVAGTRGFGTARTASLFESTDDGTTWTERPLPADPAIVAPAYIAGVDPVNADRVYVRTSSPSELLVTSDGGESFQSVLSLRGLMEGFALSPDGVTIYAGGQDDGLYVGDSTTLAFTQVSTLHVQCLATRGAELWACADDQETGGFIAGVSTDQGTTFTAKLHLGSVGAPVACGPAAAGAYACGADAGGSQCSGMPFANLCTNLGCAMDASSPASGTNGMANGGDAGGGSAGSSCRCAAAGHAEPAPLAPAAVVFSVILLRARRRRRAWAAALGLTMAALASAGCSPSPGHEAGGPDATAPPYATRDVLLDPTTCRECHGGHYDDWAKSMHAYASDDPIFLAMNARGQRETDGGLGNFCIECHAPMAVRDGKSTDGLNLGTLPPQYKGVTCYFCHSIDAVADLHNAQVALSGDLAMRGQITDPLANSVHASIASPYQTGETPEGAQACGSCHDIVVRDTDAAIERTYAEWSHSAFSTATGSTCIQCHMTPSAAMQPAATVSNAPLRTVHAHDFPAVDSVLGGAVAAGGADNDGGADEGGSGSGTDVDAQDGGGERAVVAQTLNGGVIAGALCVTGAGGVRVILDAVGVGHGWPSGAVQDRRAWVEVVAYQAGNIVYQSGVVPDGQSPTGVPNDPDFWLLRDCMFGAQGQQVNMFWQAASTEGNELPALATFNALDPSFYATHIEQRFPRSGNPVPTYPDRVTMRLRLQPIGIDVLQDLVASGDLDAAVIAEMPTFGVSLTGPSGPAMLEWTPSATVVYENSDDGTPGTCVGTAGFNVNATRTPATNPTKCSP